MHHPFAAHCAAELPRRAAYAASIALATFAGTKPTKEASMRTQLIKAGTLSLALALASQAYANWSNVTDPSELKALHTNTTLNGGEALNGHFYEGGFGTMIVKGVKTRAPWHLNGNHEMCVELREGAECFRYQRTGDFSTHYRAIRVRDGRAIPVTVERGVPDY